MSDYQQLATQFGAVRRAWKRAAALSGAAIVLTESIGILTVLLLLDWLYQPRPVARVTMWALALAGIAFLVARHVIAPLFRKISDEQIALYIEEHRRELDGVLITAAEYGQHRERLAGDQISLIDAVINEATTRSQRLSVRRLVDLSRLKKYGIGAVAGVGVYVLASILFPDVIAHHVGRVLKPWRVTAEDLSKRPGVEVLLQPLQFTLSCADTNLQRGASVDLVATLSRASDKPVVLNFRPRTAGTEWQKLPMPEIEKVNAFKATLADVSEDLEFFVSSGADKSETHKLTVYDPLVVHEIAVTTHYPAYAKLPDRVERPSNGDVAALIGSKVTVRILTSSPVKDGQLKWNTGQTQSLHVDPQTNAAMVATFDVMADANYDYTITDVNGQQAGSAAPLSVHAIPDQPPTVKIISPEAARLTHPLGEVNFDIAASDDFGVTGVDLVYYRLDSTGAPSEVRVPLAVQSGNTNSVRAVYRLALEDAQPPFHPEEIVTYHVEARDTKGQQAVSDIGVITVGHYEIWATYTAPSDSGSGSQNNEGPDLMALLSLAWQLDSQKPNLAPTDFQKQSKDIAGQMADKKSGQMRDFCDVKEHPTLARVAAQVATHAKSAHDALAAANTTTATAELRTAYALYASAMVLDEAVLEAKNSSASGASQSTALPQMAMLEQARLEALQQAASETARTEKDQTESKSAAAASKAVEDLLKKQEEVLNQAKAQTGSAAAADIAKTQSEVAEKTSAAASKAKADAPQGTKLHEAAGKIGDAAKTMSEAARAFATGKHAEGEAKATKAKNELQEAHDTLANTSRDKLEQTIARTERSAAELLSKQQSLRNDTETLAKELAGGKSADQRQQRDLQKQAVQQTQLRAEAEALIKAVDDLNSQAGQVGSAEATRSVNEAQRALRRNQPEAKMANALIELANNSPGTAAGEQQKAEAGLAKALENLRNGSDALASNRDAQLRRAARAANDVKQDVEKIAQSQPGEAPQAGAEAGKQSGTEPGTQAKAGTQAGTEAGKQPGQEPGTQAKAGEQAKAGTQAGTEAGKQSGKEPGAQSGGGPTVQKLVYDIGRLAAYVDNRELVQQKDVDQLKDLTADKAELEKRLAVDPKLLKEVSEVVNRISNKVEAEMQAKTEAGKLFASQREECPPNYRQLVNKYFEALAQQTKP